jgi:hypothetical protein
LIAIQLWIASLVSYYTLYMHIRYLGGDFFVNSVTFGICEVSACAVGAFLTVKLGTKRSYLISFFMAASSSVFYLLFRNSHSHVLPLVLAVSGFSIVWACNVNWNGNAVLFPVIFASSTNGLCNLFGRLGCALAPQLAELPQPVPMSVITGMCFYAGLLSLALRLN